MHRISLNKQLLGIVTGITGAVIVTTFFCGQGLLRLADEVVSSSKATQGEMGRNYSLLEDASLMQSQVQALLGQKDADQIEAKLEELAKSQAIIHEKLVLCGLSCQEISSAFDMLIVVNEQTIKMFLAGNLADSYAALASDVAPLFNSLLQVIRQNNQVSTVKMQLSNHAMGQETKRRASELLMMNIIVTIVIVSVATIFRRSLAKRLFSTAKNVGKLAQGNFDERLPIFPLDELGSVGSAVNCMAEKISLLLNSIAAKNDDLMLLNENLEALVAKRTQAIAMVLENVNIGLLICDRNLIIKDGYAAECRQLLGSQENNLSGISFLTALQLQGRAKENFRAIYNQIFDEAFSMGDLAVNQLPSRVSLGHRDLQLVPSLIKDEKGKVESVLFCISDVTSLAAVERLNDRNQSLIMMMSNREGFLEFLADAELLLNETRSSLGGNLDFPKLARSHLHTLKGNAAIYGLGDVAKAIHEIEGQLSLTSEDIEKIERLLKIFLREQHGILGIEYGKKTEDSLVVSGDLMKQMELDWQANLELPMLQQVIHNFFFRIKMKQASILLGPIEAAMEQLAFRLCKRVAFEFSGKDVLVPDYFTPVFRTLHHLLRNAIDHGLEEPAARGAKPEIGTIKLAIVNDESIWQIDIEDDGRGIDGELLCDKAVKLKFITQAAADQLSYEEKQALMFYEGLSSSEHTSDISGRGIGMGAVRQTVEALGGTIAIKSHSQYGTHFRITLKHDKILSQAKKVA